MAAQAFPTGTHSAPSAVGSAPSEAGSAPHASGLALHGACASRSGELSGELMSPLRPLSKDKIDKVARLVRSLNCSSNTWILGRSLHQRPSRTTDTKQDQARNKQRFVKFGGTFGKQRARQKNLCVAHRGSASEAHRHVRALEGSPLPVAALGDAAATPAAVPVSPVSPVSPAALLPAASTSMILFNCCPVRRLFQNKQGPHHYH